MEKAFIENHIRTKGFKTVNVLANRMYEHPNL